MIFLIFLFFPLSLSTILIKSGRISLATYSMINGQKTCLSQGYQYYDPTSYSCGFCNRTNEISDSRSLNQFGDPTTCRCAIGSKLISNDCSQDYSGNCVGFTCKSCGPRNSSYSDNSDCVSCDSSTLGLSSNGDCQCSPGLVLVESNSIGIKLSSKSCRSCPPGKFVLLQSARIAGQDYSPSPYLCQACPHPLMTAQITSNGPICLCPTGYSITGLSSVGPQSCVLSSMVSTYLAQLPKAQQIQYYEPSTALLDSLTIAHYYPLSASLCSQFSGPSDLSACQTLAHLCALQLFDDSSLACIQFLNIQAARSSVTEVFDTQGWVKGMPWLFFDTSGPLGAKAVCEDDFLSATVSVRGYQLEYLVSSYTLNGTFLGFQPLGTLFDYCSLPSPLSKFGAGAGSSTDWQVFGANQNNSYSCNLQSLIGQEQRFYELFVHDRASDKFFPVPVRIRNLRSQGVLVNLQLNADQLCAKDDVLVRRFFLFDVVSGITSSSSSTSSVVPAVLRFAANLTLSVSLVPRGASRIYTPVLNIGYREVETASWPVANPLLSFSVQQSKSSSSMVQEEDKDYVASYSVAGFYFQNFSRFHKSLVAGFVVGCLAFGVVLSIQLYNWNIRTSRTVLSILPQRADSQQSQLQALPASGFNFQAVHDMCVMSMKSWILIFFPFLVLVSWYLFVFFKLQSIPSILLPPDNNPYDQHSPYYAFICSLYVLTFFQVAVVVDMVFRQANADIFLVDWEPLKDPSQQPGASSSQTAGVSVWRSVLVANEWVKLQTMRRTDVRFTLFFLGFVLVGMGLQFDASQQPSLQDKTPQSTNIVLRFASSTFWWVLFSCGQFLWKYTVYERFVAEPPEQLFLDICTLAKVSLIVLEERYHGYYLHCRSPHQFADGSMMELVNMLHKEEAGLTVDRTLEGGPSGVQSFEIFLSSEWRAEFDRINSILIRSLQFMNTMEQPNRARTRLPPSSALSPNQPAGNYPYHNQHYAYWNSQANQMMNSMSNAGLGVLDSMQATLNAGPGPGQKLTGAGPLPQEKVLRAWKEMSLFLKEFIENNYAKPGLRRAMQELGYLGQMLETPPDISALDLPSVFVPDRGGFKFCRTLFLGREYDLLLMNILSYSIFDLWFNSVPISILLCYLLDFSFSFIRKKNGQNVFARKTLIDERFILG